MNNQKKNLKDNLYTLYTSYMDKKNKAIEYENRTIEQKNQEIMNRWKNQIIHDEKPALRKKLKEYTQEQFMKDFEVKYGIPMYRSKFNQYLNGTTCPPANVLRCFADLFHVSYDYLVGNDTVENPSTARIEEFFNLNTDAINTLVSLNDNPVVIAVLNALLADEQLAEYMFMNLYEQAYQSYKMKHQPDSYGDYDNEITLKNLANAISFNRYMEDALMPYMDENFAKRLQDDKNYNYWRTNHFDEYSKDNIVDSDKVTEATITSITVKPVKNKDSH